MAKQLTKLQADVLRLAQSRDLAKMTFREMAEVIGVRHPYSVQQAVNSLMKKGLLMKNKQTGAILASNEGRPSTPLLNIPILGRVSCGPATELAEDYPSNFISVSPSLAHIRRPEITFALIATGDSMSAARIQGKAVEDGDYIIVEKRRWGDALDGEYVVSRFNDMNNLKKLKVDYENGRYILLSESIEEQPPIIIAEEDMGYYAIEGVAVDVVKAVPSLN